MKVVAMTRGAGKTTEAIRIANETGAYLVVPNRALASALSKKCDRFPITFEELMETKMIGSRVRNIVIDNVDMLLTRMLPGLTIDAVTITLADDPK